MMGILSRLTGAPLRNLLRIAAIFAIAPLGACAMLGTNQSYMDDLPAADTSIIAATVAAMVADRIAPEDKPVALVPLSFSQSGNPFAGELKSALEARGYRVVEEEAGETDVYSLRYLLTDYQGSYVLRVHLDDTETTTLLSRGNNGQLLASAPLAMREDVR